ncbi:MAG: DAK2 domain-containing protein, partial [Mycobacteriales bacterium]
VRTTLVTAADAWADRAGGTSGVLWGVLLRAVAGSLDDQAAPDAGAVAAGIREAAGAVRSVGKAQPGDKTMLDALCPFADSVTDLVASGPSLAPAWTAAAETATRAAAATADRLPRIGRARPHAQQSLGTPDPGAVSFALAVTAVAAVFSSSAVPTCEAGSVP